MQMRSDCLGVILAGVSAAFVSAGAAAQGPASAPADLSGHWRLNAALSTVGGTNVAAAPAPAGQKDDAAGKKEGAEKKEGAAPDPVGTELVITQTELEVVVEEKPGTTHRYYPNGKTYKADEGESDIRSQWREDRLVFERKNRQGWKATETWQVTPDHSRLTVETRVEGKGRPKALVKRVYDRVAANP